MPAAGNAVVLDAHILNEIEANSLSKYHMKVITELETGPTNFKNFQALEYAEFNVRALSEDYMDKYQKNLISRNEQMKALAIRFANKRSNYDIIKGAKNQPQNLQNENYVEVLIKIAKDCIDSAYILATHRKQIRENANFEQLKEGQALMTQKLNMLVENMRLQPANPLVVTEHVEAQIVEPNALPAAVIPPNQNEPSWLISEEECRILYNSNLTVEKFTRAYLVKMFTICELMLPSNDIPREKKNEFLLVAPYFFRNDQETIWEKQFEKILKNLRFQKRQTVFKNLNENTGFGITELGVEFYYNRPLSNQTQFYSRKECNVGSLLNTKSCGSFKIPEKCGTFNFLLFIEKTSRLSTIHKLLPNGDLFKIN